LAGDSDEAQDDARKASDPTIADQIGLILKQSGPLTTAELFELINANRTSPTTISSVSTNLSRMKTANRVTHDGVKWGPPESAETVKTAKDWVADASEPDGQTAKGDDTPIIRRRL
jgi:hypothetical protein